MSLRAYIRAKSPHSMYMHAHIQPIHSPTHIIQVCAGKEVQHTRGMIGLLAAAANTVISPDGDHPPPHAWAPPDKQGLDDCLLKLCGSQLACGVAVTEVEEGSADAVEQNNVNPDAVHRSQLGEKQTEHIMSVDDALQVMGMIERTGGWTHTQRKGVVVVIRFRDRWLDEFIHTCYHCLSA